VVMPADAVYCKKKHDRFKQPVVETSAPRGSQSFQRNQAKTARRSNRLKIGRTAEDMPAITCTLAGMHGETASKNPTDSSIPRRHPLI
jgi:hypothetical protein